MFDIPDSGNCADSQQEKRVTEKVLKRESKRLFVIALAAVILFVVLFAAIFVFRPGELYGNTSGNFANSGLVAEKDGWIYYYCSNYPDSGLYKMRTDGTDKTKLSDAFTFDINVSGDWVYYVDNMITDPDSETKNEEGGADTVNDTESESAIYKTRINGENETIKIRDWVEDIIVVDEWIYFITVDNDSIGKIRTDGTQETLISDVNTDDISLMDGWIFYTNADDGGSLYKIKTDGTEKTLLDRSFVTSIVTEGGWVYYVVFREDKKYSIFKMRADGSQKTDLNIYPIAFFNIKDGWIFYNNTEDESCLYKARTDGTAATKISDKPALTINIAGDWIYGTLNSYRMKTDGTEKQRVE